MQIGRGVEWASHACVLLCAVPPDSGLPAAAIAEYFDVPPQYMAKHLQLLAAAGLVTSHRGRKGGYRLARPANDISLWDIMVAVEGGAPAFRCRNIRQNGPCPHPARTMPRAMQYRHCFPQRRKGVSQRTGRKAD